MPAYTALITTPFRQGSLAYEFDNLTAELEHLGLTDAEMGSIGYVFEFFTPLDKRQLDREIREIVNYYGLVLGSLEENEYW
jgi:hypothetical protein